MRILHVIPHYTPSKGGSVRVVYEMARHLGERGHDVTVVASDYGIREAKLDPGPFNVVHFPGICAWNFYVTPGLVAWARQHVGSFDVVHLHEARTLQNIIVGHAAMKQGIPYVLSAHGQLPIIIQRKLAKRAYDCLFGRRLFRSASRLVAVSPVEAQQYRHAGIDDTRIRLILNGLDLEEFAHLPAPGTFSQTLRAKGPQTKLVLYVGRLHQQKGIKHLIEAFVQVLRQDADCLLILVGPDDGERRKLESSTRHAGVGRSSRICGPTVWDRQARCHG